jgi:ribosomal protein S18 acetylase RimI-like enzyme
MLIRNAASKDYAALHNLLTQSWLQNWAPHVSEASVERFRSEDPVAAYLSGYLPAMTVAADAGSVRGMLHLVDGMVAAIHVAADAQKRGVGSMLMDYAEANGANILDVRAFNKRAIAFYQKRGWCEARHYEGNEFGTSLPTVEMRRSPSD